MKIWDTIFKKNRDASQKKFYELIYIVEKHQEQRLADLAKRFQKVNGWSEKEMLQFAVTAKNEADLDMKCDFLEGLIEDLEKGNLF